MSSAALTQKRQHAPGVAHLAVALIVILVVMLLALRAQPQTPPPIAAFAPQVNQVIKQAPNSQSGSGGGGGGSGQGHGAGTGSGSGTGPGGAGGHGSPIPAPTGQVFNCYPSNPPRQIADPQSPPCVTGGPADNGGATSMGVTRDTIDIAVPNQNYGTPNNGEHNALGAYQQFFNSHFDFYGRRLVLHEVAEISNATADQRSLADKVAAMPVFASTEFTDEGGWETTTSWRRRAWSAHLVSRQTPRKRNCSRATRISGRTP